jgi:glycosyltransferase involved in cell wall biosynthesis
VPRALHLRGMLAELITDVWMPRFTGRFHPNLSSATVTAPNISALTFELKASFARENGWKLISRRNEWFQQRAVARLTRNRNGSANGNHTVFAYSYAAEQIFRFARARGWRTVLGQIDPGIAYERIITPLYETVEDKHWTPAPGAYWDSWRTECALADRIVVNSKWCRDALLSDGVPAEKIRVLPVAYEAANHEFQRQYPPAFSSERRMRVLFLGHISLRKGVGQLLDAVKLLAGEHVEFWFVGPTQIGVSEALKSHPQIKWFGVAERAAVDRYYRDADVFIFPTLSDGFGLTQLEAQSWKLPVIASRYCGEVVRHGVNGVILEEVSPRAIAGALLNFVRAPATLNAMSMRSCVDDRFSLGALASSLNSL